MDKKKEPISPGLVCFAIFVLAVLLAAYYSGREGGAAAAFLASAISHFGLAGFFFFARRGYIASGEFSPPPFHIMREKKPRAFNAIMVAFLVLSVFEFFYGVTTLIYAMGSPEIPALPDPLG